MAAVTPNAARGSCLSFSLLLFAACGAVEPLCDAGACASTADDAGPRAPSVLINELAGTGGDFVELYNPGDEPFALSGFGLTDADPDGGVRYATSLRFATGAAIAPRGFFTIFLEADCPATVTPCVRGEFGLSQSSGDLVTVLDATNETLAQQAYPPSGAPSGSSWARKTDGAADFEVQPRSPGAPNAP